jgi:mono/diheme cytochrome c family protein
MGESRLSARRGPPLGVLWAAAAVAFASGALADEGDKARQGQELAVKLCAPCHVVSEKAGPSFADIAKGSHADPDTLRDFLRSAHSDVAHTNAMPNPELTQQQIDLLAAYLASLRPPK